jgi:hypothetical protein
MCGHFNLRRLALKFTHLEEAHVMRKWTLMVVFLLAGCSSDENPSAPSPASPSPSPAPAPTPTPTAPSPFAGSWVYRTTLTAVDRNCGHTEADIGTTEGPLGVTIASDGTFALSDGSQGTVDPAGNATITLAPRGGNCSTGEAEGGCRDHNHCDGTSVQAGDVRRWTLFRQ